jgi:6-phosphogluconolactonase (cycloisomerase 2 family)
MFEPDGIPRSETRRPQAVATLRKMTMCGFVFALMPFLLIGRREAQAGDNLPNNVVYVESNDPNGNAILAFKRALDGSLTPLPGSPFSAKGLGITPTFALGPFDSDQELIIDRSRSLLFATNGGSDTIAVFKINGNGALTHVKGSPFPSGGSNPVSVGLADDVLCVVNQDNDPGHPGQFLPNYTSFRVGSDGSLTPIPRSTISVDAGASPSQALIAPSDELMFGADFLGGILRSFAINEAGQLRSRDAQPLPPAEFAESGAPPFPLGLAVHPSRNLLYVGFVTISRIGVYRFRDSGQLKFERSVPDSGNGVCWLTINKQATRLYASNTGDPSISVYDISKNPSMPIEIQTLKYASTGGGFQFALDSSGTFLHVVTQQSAPTSDQTANAIHVFRVAHDGTLIEVPTSPTLLPVPNLVRPQGVAAL